MSVLPRLDSQLTRLTLREARLGNGRILVFALGLIITIGAVVARTPWANAFAVGVTSVFLFLVAWHGKVKASLIRHKTYLSLLGEEKARATLDWTKLPNHPELTGPLPRYFDDLDLRGKHSLLQLIYSGFSNLGFQQLVQLFNSDLIEGPEILRRQSIVRELCSHRALRRKIKLQARLDSEELMDLMSLESFVAEPFHSPSAVKWVVVLGTLQLAVLVLLAAFVFRITGPYFAIPWALSFIVFTLSWSHFYNPFGRAVTLETTLSKFLRVAWILERFKAAKGSELEKILTPFQSAERPSKVLKKISRLVGFLSLRAHGFIYVLVHLFVPWDYVLTLILEKWRARLQKDIAQWVDTFSKLEAFLSLAEFSSARDSGTFAVLSSDFGIVGESLRHPLISAKESVANDVALDRKSWISVITGSNMSGKSTYLRTIGINVVLAKAGAKVMATRFQWSLCRVRTMLRVADSLEDHVSSFYAEVKALKEILDAAAQADRPPVLYLIDEIFRGTNNRERLLGSRAYIEKIATLPALGFIATHDLELVEIAHTQAGITNFHFKESIVDGKMVFTYRLERGPCPTTNALKIMELAGLPLPKVGTPGG